MGQINVSAKTIIKYSGKRICRDIFRAIGEGNNMTTLNDDKPAAKKPAAKKAATAKSPTAKSSAAKSATAKSAAGKAKATVKKTARKGSPAKGVNVKKTTAVKPAKPLKSGPTRAAASKTKIVDTVELKNRAVGTARSAANQGKEKTSDAVVSLSKLIEDSAKTLDDNVGVQYGDYARSAADAVASFGEKLSTKDVDEMVEDARGFVRKSPAVAIGAAAVVGFLISRVVKSGMDDSQ